MSVLLNILREINYGILRQQVDLAEIFTLSLLLRRLVMAPKSAWVSAFSNSIGALRILHCKHVCTKVFTEQTAVMSILK